MVRSPQRRKEDYIRDLCARMLSASDEEILALTTELQAALTQYTLDLENRTIAILLQGTDGPAERRIRKVPPRPPRSA